MLASYPFAFELEFTYSLDEGVMEYSELFRYVVLWTAEGKEFVCVEPWMAPTGELNRGSERVGVEPGQSVEAMLAIRSIRE